MSLDRSATSKIRRFRADIDEESWKSAHSQAMACRELEYLLAHGLALYRYLVSDYDEWHEAVLSGAEPYVAKSHRRLRQRIRMWLAPCRKIEEAISDIERRGYEVDRSKEFREAVSEARWATGDPSVVLDDSRIVDARDEALDGHRRGESSEWSR